MKNGIGNLEFASLGRYFKEISAMNPLSKKEEAELMKKGDKEAIDELICRNLKYVVSVANRYKGCGLAMSDLINEGNIGLIRAAFRFDYRKGVKFITYAIWWIRQSIVLALAEQAAPVRLPIKQAELLLKIERLYHDYGQKHQREPHVDEIAKELEIKIEDVEVILRVYRSYISLDNYIRDSDDTSYIDLLETPVRFRMEEDLIHQSFMKEIDAILESLPVREKKILKMRFGIECNAMTLDEVGKKIGLSKERVRQLEKRAKNKLFHNARTKALQENY